ncbi:MAG: hypothetical protein Sapg2KO_27780 [Saprospiraceae bacterium]
MRKHLFTLVLCLFLFGFQNLLWGQTSNEVPISFFQHFAQQTEVPTLTIETDVKKLIKDKRKENYQGASITFNGLEGETIEMAAKIRSRGNIRKEVCYFPPVKLKMKKKALKKLGFDTLNQVKMVIQCQSSKQGLSYLLKENLIYQMHQPIGPISYQTKLIKLNLIDKKGKTQELFGFLIEEEREFCARLESRIPPGKGRISDRLIDRDAYLKMVFFQYMILNTDWQMINRHNLEFVLMKGQDKFMPIPYDFDYSGMVGTNYAVPDISRGIKNVQEPCFLGKDVTEEEAQSTANYFLSKKDAVYAALEADQHLTKKDSKAIRKRLDFFFKELESKRIIRNVFATGK